MRAVQHQYSNFMSHQGPFYSMPKDGYKVVTLSDRVWNRLNLLAMAAGYRGHGAVQKYLKRVVCGLRD